MTGRWMAAVLVTVAAAAGGAAGCGSSSSSSASKRGGASSSSARSGQLTVSAAASLKAAFTRYGQQLSGTQVHYSFAGSDVLAAQIEQGIKPDVFASANTKLPNMLYAKGLLDKPVVFAANKLVLAVPATGAKVHILSDLEKPGVTVAIGSPTVPIGSYTRTVLARMGPASARVLANVRSQESDVSGIVGKLQEGAVDAGFVYVTDVKATHGKLKAIALPAQLQPVVAYGVAEVKGSGDPSAARRFIAGLINGAGRTDLLQAGFLPPASR